MAQALVLRALRVFLRGMRDCVELLDATVLPNEYDDDPEAEAAFDAALKRGPRPRR